MTVNNEANAHSVPAEYDVRIATDSEMKQVADVLADAFRDDPVLNWLCRYPEVSRGMFRYEAEAKYKHHGHIYINAAKTGAAMWLPPGVDSKTPFHWRLLPAFLRMIGKCGFVSLRRAELLQKLMGRHHIAEPHFYLHAIGVSRPAQGKGIGSALLKNGLRACDRRGAVAYLETATEKNIALYERFGFAILAEERVPDNGPMMWFMQRPS